MARVSKRIESMCVSLNAGGAAGSTEKTGAASAAKINRSSDGKCMKSVRNCHVRSGIEWY